MLKSGVSNIGALANIEHVEVDQSFGKFADTFIRYFAGDDWEAGEIEESAGDMNHGSVRHSVTEGKVQGLKANTSLRQVSHSDVADVVARSEIECSQGANLGQGLHAWVGNVCAEAEI